MATKAQAIQTAFETSLSCPTIRATIRGQGSYLQYDSGVSEPGNEADRHSIKTVHKTMSVAAKKGEHLIEFSAKEISNRTELGG